MVLAIDITIETTGLVAIYAAAVATLVLIWDIYKWKISGPRIVFSMRSNMCIINDSRAPDNDTFIDATTVNKGTLPTTITNLGIIHYANWRHRLIRRSSYRGIVVNTALQPLPYILQPGTRWSGLIKQTAKVEDQARNGILICELCLSHKKKPVKARIRIEKESYGKPLIADDVTH